MSARPNDDLSDALLARNGDLAHYMLLEDLSAAVAYGTTKNGNTCTVIVAIGWAAETGMQLGRALCERVAKAKDEASHN